MERTIRAIEPIDSIENTFKLLITDEQYFFKIVKILRDAEVIDDADVEEVMHSTGIEILKARMVEVEFEDDDLDELPER